MSLDLFPKSLSNDQVLTQINSILTLRTLTPAPQHRLTDSSAFRAALLYAQEYAILAASAEDRPFVPASSVIICSRQSGEEGTEMGEVPEGVKRAFRKWEDGTIRECRVMPLTVALEASGA